jgi:hypothetical protein
MARMHVVFGDYKGPIDAQPGEKVIFIGDCVKYEGEVAGKLVQITSKYKDRSTKDPYHAEHDDIFLKLAKVKQQIATGGDVIRFEGCPVSVAEHVLFIALAGGVKNPYTDAKGNLGFAQSYLAWRTATLAKRLRGVPYQVKGPSQRGAAKPEVSPSSPPPAE